MALFWCCTNIVYRHHQHPGETSPSQKPEGGGRGARGNTVQNLQQQIQDQQTQQQTQQRQHRQQRQNILMLHSQDIRVIQRRQQVKQDRQQKQHQRQHLPRPPTLTGRRTQRRTTAPGDWSMKFTDTTWTATTTATIITTSNGYETEYKMEVMTKFSI